MKPLTLLLARSSARQSFKIITRIRIVASYSTMVHSAPTVWALSLH